ncbi:Fatty acid-binding protein, heart [Sparganum proliferum]
MQAFYGSWKLESSDDVSVLAKRLGAEIPKEKLAQMADSSLAFSPGADADHHNMQVKVGPTTRDTTFKLGEKFDHTTLDGRPVTMTIRLDGNKLTIDQEGERTMHIEIVVDGNNLTMTLKVADVSCVRHYAKV